MELVWYNPKTNHLTLTFLGIGPNPENWLPPKFVGILMGYLGYDLIGEL